MARQRDSNIELLRIICMFLMPLNHYVSRETGGIVNSYHVFDFNKNMGMFVRSVGFPALTAFVLISGYYMFGTTFKFKRIILTAVQTYVYSLLILIIGILFHIASVRQIIESIVPLFVHDVNWFVPVYIGMCFLAPFIEPYFLKCSKKQYEFALLVSITLLFVLSTPAFFDGLNEHQGVATFLTLYLVGGYIKRFSSDMKNVFTVKRAAILLSMSIILAYLTYPVGYLAGKLILNQFSSSVQWGEKIFGQFVIGMNRIFAIAGGVSLFWIFLNFRMPYVKLINKTAKHTFGVYLFHEHCIMRSFLWNHFIKRENYYSSPFFALHMFGWTAFIFIAGILIDCVLVKIYGAIGNAKWVEKLCKKVDEQYMRLNIPENKNATEV